MNKDMTYLDKEFSVTRVDLLEAMTMNRQLLQESNEKLLTRMDAEIKHVRNEIRAVEAKLASKVDNVRNELRSEIRAVETKVDNLLRWILVGIATPILIQIVLHLLLSNL